MDHKELFIELREHINKIKQQKPVIIVEGKEDKLALEKFGIGNIVTLNKPLYQIVEDATGAEQVLILTDLDKKGKELYAKLNHQLNQFGAKINNKFREFLFRRTKLRQIEGLWRYYHRLERSSHAFID